MNQTLNSSFVYNYFDINSVKEICGPSEHVMVYGWTHCYYSTIKSIIDNAINNYRDGNLNGRQLDTIEQIYTSTVFNLEGRKIEKVSVQKSENFETQSKRHWKEGITNVVLENYKRSKIGIPLMKVIFCVDIDGNSYPKTSVSVTSLEESTNRFVTNAELRRCYKLCHNLDPDVCTIAKETFTFVKLSKIDQQRCFLEKISPFWTEEGWLELWNHRIANKKVKKDPIDDKWIELFNEKLKNFIPIHELQLDKKENILPLITTGTISLGDLSEEWKNDLDIIIAALTTTEGDAIDFVPIPALIKLCAKNPDYLQFVDKSFNREMLSEFYQAWNESVQ